MGSIFKSDIKTKQTPKMQEGGTAGGPQPDKAGVHRAPDRHGLVIDPPHTIDILIRIVHPDRTGNLAAYVLFSRLPP
jgi:hypothetical protein